MGRRSNIKPPQSRKTIDPKRPQRASTNSVKQFQQAEDSQPESDKDSEENQTKTVATRSYNVRDYIKSPEEIQDETDEIQKQNYGQTSEDHGETTPQEPDLKLFDDEDEWNDVPNSKNATGKPDSTRGHLDDPEEPVSTGNKILNNYFDVDTKKRKPSSSASNQSKKLDKNEEEKIVEKYVNSKIESLNAEIAKFEQENKRLKNLKKSQEQALKELQRERQEFDAYKSDQEKQIREMWDEEQKKLKKEKQIAQRNQKAIANMPNRKEREEIDALKESVEKLKEELKQKEKKSKFTIDRQKKQISDMREEMDRLIEQVQMYEALRIKGKLQSVQPSDLKIQSGSKKKSDQTFNTKKEEIPKVNASKTSVQKKGYQMEVVQSESEEDEDLDDFQKNESASKNGLEKDHSENAYVESMDSAEEDYDAKARLKKPTDSKKPQDAAQFEDEESPFRLDIKSEEYEFSANKFYQNYKEEQEKHIPIVNQNINDNGKIERAYSNGKKEVVFNNGAKREVRTLMQGLT